MKLLLIFPNWLGKSGNYCHSAALKLGHESHLVWGLDCEDITLNGYVKNKARNAPLVGLKFRKYEENLINRNVSEMARKIRPDLIINNCPSLYIDTVKILKKYSQCLIFWAADDPTLFPTLMESLSLYDFLYAGSTKWLQGDIAFLRKKNNLYLPFGCDTDIFKKCILTETDKKKYGSAVSFVGARYSDREYLLSRIADNDLAIWGWKKDVAIRRIYRKIRGKRYGHFHAKYKTDEELFLPSLNQHIRGASLDNHTANKIYNATSIVLNLQHPQIIHAVNSKTFEIAGSGAFQILQHSGDLNGLFEKDKEIVCFSGREELFEKIQFYMNNPHEREKISSLARERVLKEHTFENRLEYILNTLGEK